MFTKQTQLQSNFYLFIAGVPTGNISPQLLSRNRWVSPIEDHNNRESPHKVCVGLLLFASVRAHFLLPGGLLTFFFFSESRFLDEDDAKGVELKAANELLVQNAMLGNQGFQKLMLNNRLKMYNLASRMFNFLKNAYDLQAKHLNHTSNAKEEFICPLFFSSVHGFAWQVLNKFCLKNFELRSLNWPSGKSFGTSHFECEVLSYLQLSDILICRLVCKHWKQIVSLE